MAGWSFSVGKVFGVEVRLHSFFVFLLILSMTWAAYDGRTTGRGVMLWLLIVLAVAVREIAKGLAAGWFGIEVKSLLLLPTGGVPAYANPEAVARVGEPGVARLMALVGPASNVLFGLTAGALVLTVTPGVDLWSALWVTPEHLLRTMVWVNLMLAAVNLLPAWPLDAASVVQTARRGSAKGGVRTFARLGPMIALALIFVGLVSRNWWLIMAGVGVLLGAQAERQGLLTETASDSVMVKDVMLTEYSILSASATLEDALLQARHTLQDVFPVVRAGNMVGAVARQSIVEALEASGNGYIQGIMTRTFQTAAPGDALMATLSRVTGQAGVSSQLVPVLEGEHIVGILTPQNLQRSMGLLTQSMARDERRAAEDEMKYGVDDRQAEDWAGGGGGGAAGGDRRVCALCAAASDQLCEGSAGEVWAGYYAGWLQVFACAGADTQFTVKAARRIQHQDGKMTLHDVGIVVYGAKADRSDRISGSEFEYDPKTGELRGVGEVLIDLAAPAKEEDKGALAKRAKAAGETSAPKVVDESRVIHVKTRGLVFLEKERSAWTDERVDFVAGGMTGNSVGASYDSLKGVIVLKSAVHMSGLRDEHPVAIAASRAEMDRDGHEVKLEAAKAVIETDSGARTVASDHAVVHVRPDGNPERVDGMGHVVLTGDGRSASHGVATGDRMQVDLNEKGQAQKGFLTGNVRIVNDSDVRHLDGRGQQVNLAFDAVGRPVHSVMTGDVEMHVKETAGDRKLYATKVDLDLGGGGKDPVFVRGAVASAADGARLQLVDKAKDGVTKTTGLRGETLVARFGPPGLGRSYEEQEWGWPSAGGAGWEGQDVCGADRDRCAGRAAVRSRRVRVRR